MSGGMWMPSGQNSAPLSQQVMDWVDWQESRSGVLAAAAAEEEVVLGSIG
jgi:hypothetical protein